MRWFGAGRGRKHRCSIVTTARWEAPYVAEWLAYHQAIGFDHVYLYCNDDDPGELYTAAAGWAAGPNPFVSFIHCPHQGQQWWMFIHFMQTHKNETEWVAFLDIDEFLSLRRDPDINAFLKRRPADVDCIYFYWTMFGHMGFAERPAGSVLRQYTRRQAGLNPWTKTITRTGKMDPALLTTGLRGVIVHPHHGWDRRHSAPGLTSRDVLGADMSGYWPENDRTFAGLFAEPGRTDRVFGEAVVHHYAFRSEADFQRRIARGLGGDFDGQIVWGERSSKDAAAFLAELDVVEDRTLADFWETKLEADVARLGIYPAPPAPLVSRGRPCLQSSVWRPDGQAEDAATHAAAGVDGRSLTGVEAFHTGPESEPWWQVDLGTDHRIEEVRLYNRMAYAERADRIRISLSSDGLGWRLVFARDQPGSFGGIDGRPLRWLPQRPETARFVRVHLPGGVLYLEQVEVFGRDAGGPTVRSDQTGTASPGGLSASIM